MKMTKNKINVWIFLLLFVPVVCVDEFYKVTKVASCFDAELEPLEWDRQASYICYNDVNLYHCVEDENGSGQMFEFCRDPVNIQPGSYPTYSDDVDRIISKRCRHGYYQSRSVDSSDISRCKKWSVCDEMGQLLCKEGTTTEDSRCRCDNNAGYTILIYGNSPSNTETCCPESDTTCKCWEKPCLPGQKLNTVYQCVVIPPCGSGFYRPNGSDDCVPIATNGSIPTGDPATQTTTPKTTTTVTQTETTRMVTKPILKPDDDDITKNVLISCCVGLFIAVVIALVVIWFCCPTARAILFCINVKEEEIDEDLEPAKALRCYWPCCYKHRPINRAKSQDLDLENPEEGQNLASDVGLGFTEDTLREKMKTSQRIRRISSSLMNVREKANSPYEDMYRQRSNTGTYVGRAVSSPSTPHNYSTLNIQRTSKSPPSRVTSITNKSIKRTTKLCCGCFGWEEIEPNPDVTNGCIPLTPTEELSFVDGTPKIGNGTSPAHPDRFMEYADNTSHVGAIPLIEVTGSKGSIAASDDISVEVFKPDSHEELTSVKEDGYKYEDFPELFNEKVHERIGIVTVCGHQGTGFRVGEDLIMTTYNLFDNNSTGVINTIKRQIITLVDTSQPSLEIEELESKCFKATLEQRHKFSSRTTKIQRLLDVWIQNNSPGFTYTDVAQIFSEIRPNIMQGIMNLVKQNWDAKIQFGFHREGESSPELQYDLASDIPYYSDRYNIIILRLIRKPDSVVPPRFYLSMESDIEVGMHLLGHPDSNILTIDPLCHIYMGDNLMNDIKVDTEKAYKWCENNYDKWDSSDNDARTTKFKHLASQYSVLQQGDDMIFNCSRPILHDATGCLGVVMNKSWPEMFKIQTMLLTGHPQILQDFAKNFDPKKEKVKLFYEKGLTMKKVYRLLSNAKVIHLREDLFAKFEDVNKDQKNKETEDKKKKKKKPTKHIHKHKHKHIVIVKGKGSSVAVGDHAKFVLQGQVNNEGQVQVSDDEGQSDIEEEEVSGSQINKDREVSGTNGDTEGNSDSSSSEKSENSFQGFKPSTKSKSETPEQTKVETKIERQLKSATPKTEESKTKESQSQLKSATPKTEESKTKESQGTTIKSLNDEEHLDKGKEPSSQMNHSGHTESSNDSLERLIETLKEQGMRIRGSVPKDGNCFFHAVVDQLKRLDMSQKTLSHFQLRSQVVWYLKYYPEEQLTDVKDCVEGSWDEYVKKMERDGEYADHVIIEFTAKYLQREILIVTSSPGSKNANRENVIINEEDGRNGCPLLLGHVYENHYESLQMKDEAELEMDCGNASDG